MAKEQRSTKEKRKPKKAPADKKGAQEVSLQRSRLSSASSTPRTATANQLAISMLPPIGAAPRKTCSPMTA